jgi:uroporphyrinogen decarboxylase
MGLLKRLTWLADRKTTARIFSKLGKTFYEKKNSDSMPAPFKTCADFDHFLNVLLKKARPGPVPIIELAADVEVMVEVTGWKDFPVNLGKEIMWGMKLIEDWPAIKGGIMMLELELAFAKAVGYDFVTTWPIVPITRSYKVLDSASQGTWRAWQHESKGLITNRELFDRYPWPSADEISIFPLNYLEARMPPGMKIMMFCWGIFEDVKALMGLQNLAIASIDNPDLVDDILERLTMLAEAAVARGAAHPATGAVFYAEDMGYNQALMLSPKFMREHVIPRQKRIAEAAHRAGKSFFMHSCGRIDSIMDDLIDTVGIDGKHSYEDNIMPVEEAYAQYHDRIAVLGGVDMDLLTRGTPEDVRTRTRHILDACGKDGGFAIGSGNTLASYINIENYYAMLDETKKWNEQQVWSR